MKIKLVMQAKQNECGLCAVAMLASYYGFRKNIEFYRKLFDIGRDGMSAKNICDILNEIKLVPSFKKCDSISKEIPQTSFPCILFYNMHFVVLEKVKRGYCYICDPAAGYVKCSCEEINSNKDMYIISVEKSEDFKKATDKEFTYGNILKMIKGIEWILAFTIITSIIVNILNIMIPQILQNIIDSLIKGNLEEQKSKIAISICAVSALYLLFTKVRNDKLVELQGTIIEKFSLYTMKHLLRISYKFYDSRSTGDILYRINILAEVEKQISGIIISLIIAVTSICVLFGYICITSNVYLILIMLAIIMLLCVFVFEQNKMLLERNRKLVNGKQNLNVIQTEIISQIYQIKSMKIEKSFFELFKEKNIDYNKKFVYNQKGLSDFSMFIGLFEMFIPLLAILFMIMANLDKGISIGGIFTLYIIMQLYIKYVMSLANTCVQVYSMKNSLYYINDILNEDEEKCGSIKVEKFKKLSFHDVSFRYNESQENILRKVCFDVSSGQKIAIVGNSGSGKSTIIKLLAKLYKSTEGSILINEKYNIEDINEENYSSMIGIVSQQTVMFNKTIRDNLKLYDDKITDDMIKKSLEIVNMWNDVNQMPMKLDTFISDESKNLSGGQIQKLSIARAILKNPKILVLDESTSSLDASNEIIIHNNLKAIGVTLIVISHRLSTVQDADCIYVLQNGCIQGSGSHAELMISNQLYHELYVKQCINSNEIVE